MLAGLAPARRRFLLAAVGLLLAAVLALAALAAVRFVGGTDGPVAQDRPGPVLLVPGYGGATSALAGLADSLTAAGRDATVVALPGDGTGDLAGSAAALDDAAQAALARTGAPSVDIVGYSAGGVVARLWAADGGARLARRIVTLGSPHHGTTLAEFAGSVVPGDCPAGCRELAPDSDLLRRLAAGDETPDGPTWVSIWTTQDETVRPPDSARLDGALNLPVQSVCPASRVGHGGLPQDPLVAQLVLAELAPGPPVRLGPGDCSRLTAAAAQPAGG